MHLSEVTTAFAIALVPTYGLAFVLSAGDAAIAGLDAWFLMAPLAVMALHGLWFSTVRGWRDEGRLTPNVVIVGATKHAERLITAALARRDVNVIGVFDDRLARSPEALSGVPVLGDVQALVSIAPPRLSTAWSSPSTPARVGACATLSSACACCPTKCRCWWTWSPRPTAMRRWPSSPTRR